MNDAILLVGRILFSAVFLLSGMNHFMKLSYMAQYAASQGLPAPTLVVAITGLMILAGGLSILLGYRVRWGALLLVIFLIPTTLIMHQFWGLADAGMAQNQMAHFLKNLAAAGGALIVYWYATVHPGRWPYSIGR